MTNLPTMKTLSQYHLLPMKTTLYIQFFPMLRYTSTTSKYSLALDSIRTSCTIQTFSRGQTLNTKKFCIAEFMTSNKKVNVQEAPVSDPFFKRRMKTLSRFDGFMLNGKLCFSTLELRYPNREVRTRLKNQINFFMISHNPNVKLVLDF